MQLSLESKRKKSIFAFTLIELSIVLTVIGLIVAGVVSGRSLIKQASLRKDVAFVAQVQLAISQFKVEYLAMPGDFPSASTYWSTAVNGNGDGTYGTWYCPGNAETYTFWQHLALAGLIPGTFSGTGSTAYIGQNVPAVAMNPSFEWCANYDSHGSIYATHNAIMTGYGNPEIGGTYPFLQKYAAAMDRKIDDGFPKAGRMISYCSVETSVNSATDKTTVYYIETSPDAGCSISIPADPQFIYK
jgi:prepilin-type N-terminal cleavage/methylation domain-containing protein